MFRDQLDTIVKREEQLAAQETALDAMLSSEQAQWTDFSQRLEAIERSLTNPTSP